jgi:hypothetical protein
VYDLIYPESSSYIDMLIAYSLAPVSNLHHKRTVMASRLFFGP